MSDAANVCLNNATSAFDARPARTWYSRDSLRIPQRLLFRVLVDLTSLMTFLVIRFCSGSAAASKKIFLVYVTLSGT